MADRYEMVQRTLGFGLTMMSIVQVSLVLGGLLLGPVGWPIVMAGVGLSIATACVVVGLMIANYVKKKKIENEQAMPIQLDAPPSEIPGDISNVKLRVSMQHHHAADKKITPTPHPSRPLVPQIPKDKPSLFIKAADSHHGTRHRAAKSAGKQASHLSHSHRVFKNDKTHDVAHSHRAPKHGNNHEEAIKLKPLVAKKDKKRL